MFLLVYLNYLKIVGGWSSYYLASLLTFSPPCIGYIQHFVPILIFNRHALFYRYFTKYEYFPRIAQFLIHTLIHTYV